MAAGNPTNVLSEALTFDDVLLVPGYSEVLPGEVDVSTRLTRTIELRAPILSAAMDTVTEAATAICMARNGGLGIIHKNLTPEEQAREVRRVKKSESGMITEPITITPDQTLRQALQLMRDHRISGLPVVRYARPVGILTSRDIRFETNLDQLVGDVMTRNPITVEKGITLDRAKQVLHKHRIEKLLVVNAAGELLGLITVKDILSAESHS
ncbi:MAG: IMP dehydrogenase, partial [Nannocystaceae bacterium]